VKSSLQVYLQRYFFLEGVVNICLHSRTSQSDAAHSVKVLAICVPYALLATEMCHIKSKVWYVCFERMEN
jgi:hypothetical protein